MDGHTDWVRDVAWAPNIGLPRSYIATASQVRLARFNVCSKERCLPRCAGQNRAHLDQRFGPGSLGQDCPRSYHYFSLSGYNKRRRQVPRRCVACFLESCRQHLGGQLWRRQGHALEGELEGWLGVRERCDELSYLMSYCVLFCVELRIDIGHFGEFVYLLFDRVSKLLPESRYDRVT